MKNLMLLSAFGLILSSCSVEVKEIDYGNEACHFCQMTIVDNRHAAQLVTQKGKTRKFDAIECMINHLSDENEDNFAHIVVTDYHQGGKLINAQNATFLISKNIPSPMGAYLSAFEEENAAKDIYKSVGGKVYYWGDVKPLIRNQTLGAIQ